MNNRKTILINELRRRGALNAGEIMALLGISQPTVSRLLADMRRENLIHIGRGRSSHYASLRPLAELGTTWPLYEIDINGKPDLIGQLHSLESQQWLLSQKDPWNTFHSKTDFLNGIYPGIPWFLYDLRPQGFLGRTFARNHSASLNAPADPRLWNDDAVLSALIRFGYDLPGAFILGTDMLSVFQKSMLNDPDTISTEAREENYPKKADNILAGQLLGSSAGGEQPKFTTCLNYPDGTIKHVIVKFSGSSGRPEDRRWADLLFAEQIANNVLSENNIPSADTSIIESDGRVFLESIRFDRVGTYGRRNLVSLEAVDTAFFGEINTPWTAAAKRLYDNKWLSKNEADRLIILWWFGTLIGNSDMHYGNISFFLNKTFPLSLAPSYDMVPMLYRPNIEGKLPNRVVSPPPPPPESISLWTKSVIMAEQFWNQIYDTPEISNAFRNIAKQNAKVVSRYRNMFVSSFQ